MEKAYWLSRKRASLKLARERPAPGAIDLLRSCWSLWLEALAETQAIDLADSFLRRFSRVAGADSGTHFNG